MLLREIGFEYAVLLACLFVGSKALQLLGFEQECISAASGINLFLIALRMISSWSCTLRSRAYV